MAIFVLVFVPGLLIYLFWMVHILPEKIAEKRHHPQADAIKALCLLSLVFGGLLWPFAWLWAYSKPVFYKMAYGTDTHPEAGHHGDGAAGELVRAAGLRDRIAQLAAPVMAVDLDADPIARGQICLGSLTDGIARDRRPPWRPLHQCQGLADGKAELGI